MKIRQARERKKLTQAQLAARVGVDSMTVSRWERGVFSPTGRHLLALARALDATPEDLLEG